MNFSKFLFLLACSVSLLAAAPTADPPPAYPLDRCVVSGEKLGSMGAPYVHTHQAEGQPDRTVLLCCRGCIRSFNADPAKYLAKIDAAQEAAPENQTTAQSATSCENCPPASCCCT